MESVWERCHEEENPTVKVYRSTALLLAFALAATPCADAASTGTEALHTPQGSAAGTANGDYVTASTGGMNTFYRYFIEVPAGLNRLEIEIFDADLGAGGASEDTAGRDRDRGGYNTTATYTLLDPSGAVQPTRFTTGNTTTPTGADNAWLDFYNASGSSVRDNFGTAAYTNNDGTSNWTGSWIESDGGGGGATGGAIQINGGELRLQDDEPGTPSVQREVNLSGLGLVSAFLTFDYRTSGNLEDGDQISVQVSGNGGGSWTTLETFFNDGSGSLTFDITSSIASNTRIRWILAGGYTGSEFFYVDNLQITDGPKTAGHWELRVSQSAGGDDINGLGIRAHDGTAGAGGTELNVYADSILQIGANPPASGTDSRSYTLHPWVTAGCTASRNDFDFDSNSGTVGSASFSSRTGAFSQNYASGSLSQNNTWDRETFSGWTSDTAAADYGIWSNDITVISYLVGGTPNGNYATYYVGNYQTGANPPSANPETDTFRIYLPNDAGGAPAKPYVEQVLTHKSGPNPVLVGQTSRYQVTVRVVNPAAQAITFSAANLVTANVPGGTVLYAGNAAVGQGSIVSQPAINGSGNITWNPGTLAAGATSILTYQVNVTPTSGGQRVPVTATPASGNGTRARYLDETGNTTQARATYQFGPLCELAIREGELLTVAVVSSFRALPGRTGGVLVEWTTAAEERTAGFRLLRRDRRSGKLQPVHEGLLAALPGSPQGGTYRFLDGGAVPREPQVYVLEEIEAGGTRRRHGPFRVNPSHETADAPEMASGYERAPHPASRGAERSVAETQSVIGEARESSSLRIAVRTTGLHHLSTRDIASFSGRPAVRVEKQLREGQVALSREGRAIAWQPDLQAGSIAGIFFYGEAPDSLYSDVSVYRLDLGQTGLRMTAAPVSGATAGSLGDTFAELRRTERDVFPATAITPNPESDYWFQEFLVGGDATFGVRTFDLDAAGADPLGAAELTVDLHGATTTGLAGEHEVAVSLNGTPLGFAQWEGIAPHRVNLDVPSGVLLATGNKVELTARVGGGASHSVVYLDGFDLAYQRTFKAENEALTFRPDGLPGATVTGFSDPAVRLLDVSDPRKPRWVTGATVEADPNGGWRLSFAPAPGARYLAAGPAALQAPAAIRPWGTLPRFLRADYLVIAPAALRRPAEKLAALRRQQKLTVEVIDLEQIADEFGQGVATPHAIRAFLADVWKTASRRPRYVALAGEGTLDYRNLQGFGDSILPPLLVPSAGGLFPSDNRLGDVNNDGLPEMAVGRIPVLTAAELSAWVDKIAAYEKGGPAEWARSVLLLSDAPDRGRMFAMENDQVAAQLPSSLQAERIDLGAEPLEAARARLFFALNEGAVLVNYLGHGGLDRLAGTGLLTNADVPALANGGRLPVLTAMTCTVNRFAVPGVPSLGEVLVKSPSGGAAAVFGPTGLADNEESRRLAEIFYRRTADRGEMRLGDLILRSFAEMRSQGGDESLLDIYNLIGDPALRLRSAPPPVDGGGGGGE
jgi:hypothetical protein